MKKNIDHRDEAMLRLAQRALQAPRRMMRAAALQRLAGLGRQRAAVAVKVVLPLPMSLVAGRGGLWANGNVGGRRTETLRGAGDVERTRSPYQGSMSMKTAARAASGLGPVALASAGKGLPRPSSGPVAAPGEKARAVASLSRSLRVAVAAGHAAQRWGVPGAEQVERNCLERVGGQYARASGAVASGVAVTAVAQSYAPLGGVARSVAPVEGGAVARARESRPGAASTAMPARMGAEQGWDAQRWLGERMVRQASLPPAAANGFDTRMGPDWHGVGSFV